MSLVEPPVAGRRSPGRYRAPPSGSVLRAVAVLFVAAPLPISAQTGFVVQGWVYDAVTNQVVVNATVTLDGYGSVLTSDEGAFTFRNVRPDDYELRVGAYGYMDLERSLKVDDDTEVSVALQIDALVLDPLDVELSTIDFDGRARDGRLDIRLIDAEVLSDQGHEERTNAHGRFDLDDVFEHVPLRVVIRSFGYLPLDTTLVPDDMRRYDFDLVSDPIMDKMIAGFVERLEQRSEDRFYEYGPSISREEMSRRPKNATLQTVMEAKYPRHILRRIGCFVYDEREVTDREERVFLLQNTLVNELERVELLEFPSGPGRLLMARVYTRLYFQRKMGSSTPLRTPRMIPIPGGVICR